MKVNAMMGLCEKGYKMWMKSAMNSKNYFATYIDPFVELRKIDDDIVLKTLQQGQQCSCKYCLAYLVSCEHEFAAFKVWFDLSEWPIKYHHCSEMSTYTTQMAEQGNEGSNTNILDDKIITDPNCIVI